MPIFSTIEENALNRLHRYREALQALRRQSPATPEAWKLSRTAETPICSLRVHAEPSPITTGLWPSESDSVQALYGRGSALIELERHDEAVGTFERLLAIQARLPLRAGHDDPCQANWLRLAGRSARYRCSARGYPRR